MILDGKNLVKNTYTYDNNGNRLTKAQLNGTIHYQYDPMNRLTQVQYPTYSETLFYDKVGNRTKRITENIEELYGYDAKNRLIELTSIQGSHSKTTHYEYDKQGNLLKDNQATYTYDGFNRTEKVSTFEGKVQINHYDAEGLRHEIEENGQLVQFIFNTNREVVIEKTESDTIRLIRGYDITASQSEQARTYYHYVSDELGSTTHIFEGKEIRNRYAYDAFGNLTICEEQVTNRFKYTGQQQDPITQQYYLRARFYNPIIARFTQEDPYRGAGLNLYAYCDNNPIIYFDPSGYAPCDTKKALYKKYREQGLSASEANHAANIYLIERNKGIGAAEAYKQANNYVNKKTTVVNNSNNHNRQPKQYHSFFNHDLKPNEYYSSDSVQFRKANKELIKKMNTNKAFRKDMLTRYPELKAWMENNPNLSCSPPNLTWHHNETTGRLNLVDREDHSLNHGIYHPTGKGGRDIWGGGKLGRQGKLDQNGNIKAPRKKKK